MFQSIGGPNYICYKLYSSTIKSIERPTTFHKCIVSKDDQPHLICNHLKVMNSYRKASKNTDGLIECLSERRSFRPSTLRAVEYKRESHKYGRLFHESSSRMGEV